MTNKSFHSLNVSNTWNIPSSDKNILGIFYNCDAEDHISQNPPLPRNEENIKQAKEACEASLVSSCVQGKGIQLKY